MTLDGYIHHEGNPAVVKKIIEHGDEQPAALR